MNPILIHKDILDSGWSWSSDKTPSDIRVYTRNSVEDSVWYSIINSTYRPVRNSVVDSVRSSVNSKINEYTFDNQ